MDRNYLTEKLYYIRENSNKSNAKIMLELLDEIFECKPVTLLYFNVKAKVLCDIKEYEEAIELLQFKINLNCLEKEYLETCNLLIRAYKELNDESNCSKWQYLKNVINYGLTLDFEFLNMINTFEDSSIKLEEKFINNDYSNKLIEEITEQYWKSWSNLETAIMYAVQIKKYGLSYENIEYKDIKETLQTEINYNFLLDELMNKEGKFTLVADKDNYTRILVLAKALRFLGHDVYILTPPILEEVENWVNITETVDISIENIEVDEDGIIKIIPIEIIFNKQTIGNNTHLLLEKIVEEDEEEFSILIATGELFDSLCKIKGEEKRIQRLSEYKSGFFQKKLSFGYFGSYLSYISKLYSIDVKTEIEKPSECKFSIVIPVRNSAESLKYTLQTCIEQRNMDANDYEIIVSDNSSANYTGIEELVKRINNPKIKYFRTPKELALGRSFEYAFIKAKGEFIFSLGADDGLLPWGLETIEKSLNVLPEDDIIQWDRGFFVWPNNSKMDTQAGQFSIPRKYDNKNIEIARYTCLEQLINTLNNPDNMYELPMLYINSGFRRRYIKKLFNSTGRLWDGGSQDVYIGIVNLIMYETIPHIMRPVTIAGMTMASAGIEGNRGYSDNKTYVNKVKNIGSYYGNIVPYGEELNFICVSLDICLLYSSFFRTLNIYKDEKIKLISSKIELSEKLNIVANRLSCDNIRFDYDIQTLKYSAYHNNVELGKWFESNVEEIIKEPRIIEYNNEKVYDEGFTSSGGLQLDARKFNVNTIYEAVKLFENICNL